MAKIVLFHSVLGLRPGVKSFAQQLEEAGHTVITPDLYDGIIYDDYEAGNKKWTEIGIPAILERARAVCQDIESEIIFAGFSNGAAVAEILAATDPRARGAILMHGALPLEMTDVSAWPSAVPVQLHYNENDPFRNPDNDKALQQAVEASGATFTEFLYPGDTHLFADPDLSDYNQQSAEFMMERIQDYLS